LCYQFVNNQYFNSRFTEPLEFKDVIRFIDPARPRYWISIPEIWAPIARTVASPMPKPAAKEN
jgi:hypothetical protein